MRLTSHRCAARRETAQFLRVVAKHREENVLPGMTKSLSAVNWNVAAGSGEAIELGGSWGRGSGQMVQGKKEGDKEAIRRVVGNRRQREKSCVMDGISGELIIATRGLN